MVSHCKVGAHTDVSLPGDSGGLWLGACRTPVDNLGRSGLGSGRRVTDTLTMNPTDLHCLSK